MSLQLEKVHLIACNFKLKDSKDCSYSLELKHYESQESSRNDGFEYTALLTFNIMSRVRKPVMAFECTFALGYKGDEEGRKRLKEHIVVAHSIPYLREFVSNVTMRSPLPVLVIAPVNAPELWREYCKKHSKEKFA